MIQECSLNQFRGCSYPETLYFPVRLALPFVLEGSFLESLCLGNGKGRLPPSCLMSFIGYTVLEQAEIWRIKRIWAVFLYPSPPLLDLKDFAKENQSFKTLACVTVCAGKRQGGKGGFRIPPGFWNGLQVFTVENVPLEGSQVWWHSFFSLLASR